VGEKPKGWDLADYVLSRAAGEEQALMQDSFAQTEEAVRVILTDGADAAMNRFNTKVQKAE
jgi:PTH1 family peptidyl-tRNA hydrolase